MAKAKPTTETVPVEVVPVLSETTETVTRNRTRTPSPIAEAAAAALTAAETTIADGVSRPYRIEGAAVQTFMGHLRRLAAGHNRTIKSAPSQQVEGAVIWQLSTTPPVRRVRKPKP